MVRPPRTRIRLIVAAALLLAVGTSRWPVAAHESDVRTTAVLDEVNLEVRGTLDVEIAGGTPERLVLRNGGDDAVEVLDDDGRAFLRIGPDGVEANLGSLAWFETNDPLGVVRADAGVRNGTAPDTWSVVAERPEWAWFDHRLHPAGLDPLAQLDEESTVAYWEVPLRAGDRTGAIRGRILHRPLLGSHRPILESAVDDDRLVAQLIPGATPGFFVRVVGDVEVVVRGVDGEPFLRLRRDGVEANVASPSWSTHTRLAELDPPPVAVDADAAPVWERVATTSSYTWLDPRAAPSGEAPPADPTRRTITGRWEIPLEIDGEATELAGRTEWVPLPQAPTEDDAFDWGRLLATCVAAGVAALALGRVWRRRS